jgi:energy-coupling factor transport system substrate-specific component
MSSSAGGSRLTVARRAVPTLLVVGIALNVLGGLLVDFLKLPIYLDTAGTMLVAVVAGPWWGALAGALSNALLSFWIPADLWFGITNAAIGIIVGIIVRRRGFKDYLTPLLAGLTAGIVAPFVSRFVAAFVFGDYVGGPAEVVGAGLAAAVSEIASTGYAALSLINIVDKLISIYIVFYITRALPDLAPDAPAGFIDPVKGAADGDG